jgi:hypothetical protein
VHSSDRADNLLGDLLEVKAWQVAAEPRDSLMEFEGDAPERQVSTVPELDLYLIVDPGQTEVFRLEWSVVIKGGAT